MRIRGSVPEGYPEDSGPLRGGFQTVVVISCPQFKTNKTKQKRFCFCTRLRVGTELPVFVLLVCFAFETVTHRATYAPTLDLTSPAACGADFCTPTAPKVAVLAVQELPPRVLVVRTQTVPGYTLLDHGYTGY